ncbi:MAG: hypothetical protein P4L99_12220 [Chthoniobacter sp.]|nr:hypothetical protein [Chthoniobacter sp.]
MNPRPFSIIALFVAFIGAVPAMQALPPLSRKTSGTIKVVDLPKRRAIVYDPANRRLLTLAFDRHTEIWRDSQPTTPLALAPGQLVQVTHLVPFFGPAYVSRIDVDPSSRTKRKDKAVPFSRPAIRPARRR